MLDPAKLEDEYNKASAVAIEAGKKFSFIYLYPNTKKNLIPKKTASLTSLVLLTWRDISDALVNVASGKDLDESTRVFVSHFAEHINEAVEMEYKGIDAEILNRFASIIGLRTQVERELEQYLDIVGRELLADEDLVQKGIRKISSGVLGKGGTWWPYYLYLNFRTETVKWAVFCFQIGVQNETDEEFKQRVWVWGVPPDQVNQLSQKIEQGIKSLKIPNCVFWHSVGKKHNQIHVVFYFDPSQWKRSLEDGIAIFKSVFLTVNDYSRRKSN